MLYPPERTLLGRNAGLHACRTVLLDLRCICPTVLRYCRMRREIIRLLLFPVLLNGVQYCVQRDDWTILLGRFPICSTVQYSTQQDTTVQFALVHLNTPSSKKFPKPGIYRRHDSGKFSQMIICFITYGRAQVEGAEMTWPTVHHLGSALGELGINAMEAATRVESPFCAYLMYDSHTNFSEQQSAQRTGT